MQSRLKTALTLWFDLLYNDLIVALRLERKLFFVFFFHYTVLLVVFVETPSTLTLWHMYNENDLGVIRYSVFLETHIIFLSRIWWILYLGKFGIASVILKENHVLKPVPTTGTHSCPTWEYPLELWSWDLRRTSQACGFALTSSPRQPLLQTVPFGKATPYSVRRG